MLVLCWGLLFILIARLLPESLAEPRGFFLTSLLLFLLPAGALAALLYGIVLRPLRKFARAMERADYVELPGGGRWVRELQLMAAHYNSVLDSTSTRLEGQDRATQLDSLTQVANRSRLETELEVELRRAERYGSKFSVLFMDLDQFKQINERFGHLAGDQLLSEVADLILSRVRSADTVGRWGGDEFMILCRQTSISRAARLAESLRETLHNARFLDGQRCTISIGMTAQMPDDSLATLFGRAREALEEAKRLGRDQVFGRPISPGP